MPNAIKYNTSAETLALKKGNFWIGTGDVGKGPTSSTGFYNGITPPSGGYTIYLNKATGGPSIYTVNNNTQLISLTNSIAGASYNGPSECLNYFATQTDKMVFNSDAPSIITDGLVLNLDAGFTPSYPTTGTTWYDVSSSVNSGTLTNGPTYSPQYGGSIVFDGVDDYCVSNSFTSVSTSVWTCVMFLRAVNAEAEGYVFGWDNENNSYGMTIGTFMGNWISHCRGGSNNWITGPAVSANTWTCISVTYNGSIQKIYGNGVLVNAKSASFSQPIAQPVYIGKLNRGYLFNGSVGLTLFYNRALTAEEILQNYNATKDRYTTTLTNLNNSNIQTAVNLWISNQASATATYGPIWQWDTSAVTTMANLFNGKTTFNSDISAWNTSNVTDMQYMFYGATVFNQNIGGWNTSKVTNMTNIFGYAPAFNQNIGAWNTSSVINMSSMFINSYGAIPSTFNNGGSPSINNWNTSKVINMGSIFMSAEAFNQPIGNWNTGNVTNMNQVFRGATSFNQNIGSWNTAKVTTMNDMFLAASSFNQNIGAWNVGGVTSMNAMFAYSAFNNGGSPSINNWDVSKVTDMYNLFTLCTVFNQPIGSWNTISVTNMTQVFYVATSFNQNISSWNTSNVTNMTSMFNQASAFNQNIGSWNVGSVTSMNGMFAFATSFNQNIGSWNVSNVTDFNSFMVNKNFNNYSTANLNAIYNGWSSRSVKPNITISFGTIKYTSASSSGRAILTGSPNNWTITDGGT